MREDDLFRTLALRSWEQCRCSSCCVRQGNNPVFVVLDVVQKSISSGLICEGDLSLFWARRSCNGGHVDLMAGITNLQWAEFETPTPPTPSTSDQRRGCSSQRLTCRESSSLESGPSYSKQCPEKVPTSAASTACSMFFFFSAIG